jgi:hypothetical protein
MTFHAKEKLHGRAFGSVPSTVARGRRRDPGRRKRAMFALNSNPQATYGSSLVRRIASSRAFLILSRSRACPRPTRME